MPLAIAMGGHVAHPSPLNQFNRLVYRSAVHAYEKGDPWNCTDPRRPGHDYDSENCMATAGAVAREADTNSTAMSNPIQIRRGQDDIMGGIGVDDVDVAFHRLWGTDLLTPDNISWNEMVSIVRNERRHAVYGGDYGKLPESMKLQAGGDFSHAFNCDDVQDSTGYVLTYDSLGLRPYWRPQAPYKAAAEALAIQERGSAGRLFVGFTRQRPALGGAAPTYSATIVKPTALWNASTKRWVYNGTNQIQPVVAIRVRAATYYMGTGKTPCYPVAASSPKFAGYYVPKVNVKLGSRV